MSHETSNYRVLDELQSVKAKYRELAEAAIAYDLAIQSAAGDPEKMSSFCTAQGDTLDSLYVRWLGLAMEASGDPVAQDDSPSSDRAAQPTDHPRGEPVAYRYALESGKYTVFISKARARYLAEHGAEVDPLYSAMSKPEQARSPEIPDGSKPDQAEDWRIGRLDEWTDIARRKGYVGIADALDALPSLAEQAVGDGVTDEQVERAAKKHMEIRGLGMLSPWESCTEETRASYRIAMRRALEDFASLASRPVEAVATPVEVTVKLIMEIVDGVIGDHGGEDLDDEDVRHSFGACLRERLEAAIAHPRPTGGDDLAKLRAAIEAQITPRKTLAQAEINAQEVLGAKVGTDPYVASLTAKAIPTGDDVEKRKLVDGLKMASGYNLKDGTGASDALYTLAVEHGADEAVAAGFAHHVNGALNELQGNVYSMAQLALHRTAPTGEQPGEEAVALLERYDDAVSDLNAELCDGWDEGGCRVDLKREVDEARVAIEAALAYRPVEAAKGGVANESERIAALMACFDAELSSLSRWEDIRMKIKTVLVNVVLTQPRPMGGVPDEMGPEDDPKGARYRRAPERIAYRRGWNDCRFAMLAAAPEAPRG